MLPALRLDHTGTFRFLKHPKKAVFDKGPASVFGHSLSLRQSRFLSPYGSGEGECSAVGIPAALASHGASAELRPSVPTSEPTQRWYQRISPHDGNTIKRTFVKRFQHAGLDLAFLCARHTKAFNPRLVGPPHVFSKTAAELPCWSPLPELHGPDRRNFSRCILAGGPSGHRGFVILARRPGNRPGSVYRGVFGRTPPAVTSKGKPSGPWFPLKKRLVGIGNSAKLPQDRPNT